MPTSPQVCYNNVRVLDYPCLPNVRRIDLGILPMLREFHQHGVLIDPPHFAALSARIRAEEAKVKARIEGLGITGLNWNSPDQVSRLIFKDLGLKPPGRVLRTQSGEVSSDDTMLTSVQDQHPVVTLILDGRELSKLRTTYADKLPLMADSDGRVRGKYSYTRTGTGRLAMSDPNCQNIPARSELGNEVRNGFIAAPGCVLASADYSQIEMVLAADMSGDTVMLDVFRNGLDIHTETVLMTTDQDPIYREYASRAKAEENGEKVEWGTGEKDRWKKFKFEWRLPFKTVGFALLYGQTPDGMQMNIESNGGPRLQITAIEDIIARWFHLYAGVHQWMELQYQRVRRYGMNWTAFGRPRLIPGARSRVPRVVNEALRQAGNHPIQGTAGDILKIAMAAVMEVVSTWRSHYPSAIIRPLLQVHDELVFELSRDIAEDFMFTIRMVMTGICELAVPIGSSSVIGARWGELKG